MNKCLWVLLLAAACAAPTETPLSAVLRQANTDPPVGFEGPFLIPPASTATDLFGHALTWGDFNGDGVVDLAVGAPGTSNDNGMVWIFYGPLDRVPSNPVGLAPNFATAGSRFGAALAATDFNADKADDLVVGAPGYTASAMDGGALPAAGGVFVYLASTTGINTSAPSASFLGGSFGANAALGSSLTFVKPDSVWAGAPGALNKGAVQLIGGATGGVPVLRKALFGASFNEQFGAATLSTDIDSLGRDDVLVGSPGANAVSAWLSGTGTTGSFDAGTRTTGSMVPGDGWGSALAFVDSARSVAVGAPNAGAGLLGGITVAPLNASGGLGSQESAVGPPGGHLGTALAVGDLDPDGNGELYVGAPGASTVMKYLLRPLRAVPSSVSIGMATGSSFGCALVSGVDAIGQDGVADLAVGAEKWSDGMGYSGGAVFLFAGDGGPRGGSGDGGARGDAGMNNPDGGVPVLSIHLDAVNGSSVTFSPVAATGQFTAFEWDFGDMSPTVSRLMPIAVTHNYTLPGGYRVRLLGRTASDPENPVEAFHQAKLPDIFGNPPPTIACTHKVPLANPDGSFSVGLSAATIDANTSIEWDVGLDAPLNGPDVAVILPRGTRRVHCYALSPSGLWAHDSFLLTLGDGPPCRLGFDPPSGPAPLDVLHEVEAGPVLVQTATLTADDGSPIMPGGPHTYDHGFHPVTLKVGAAAAVGCIDVARVFAWKKPAFTSAPPGLTCGMDYTYAVSAVGGELSLVDGGPGVSLDSNGTLHAPAPVGPEARVSFTLAVTSPFAEQTQSIDAPLTCAEPMLQFQTPCSCSGGGVAWPLAALLLGAKRRRRR